MMRDIVYKSTQTSLPRAVNRVVAEFILFYFILEAHSKLGTETACSTAATTSFIHYFNAFANSPLL